MSEEFLERLDRVANAAPQGLLVHRATLDLRAFLVRPGPRVGRATLAPPVRLAPQAPSASVAPSVVLEPSAQPGLRAQQEQRARLVRRD